MSTPKHPLISVIMPAYNAAAYLNQALDSILAQTYSNFELIVLNDGSTDQTDKVIESYTDTRIQYINNQSNVGIVATLNKGLSAANGEYIARMDADDISTPVRFERQINFLENHPTTGVLGSAIRIIDRRGKYQRSGFFPTEDTLIRWVLMFANPIAHPSVIIRRELLQSCNGYRDVPAEDIDLWERMSHITTLSNLPEPLLSLRRYSSTRTAKYLIPLLESSAKTSQRMMLRLLGGDVQLTLVEKVWGKELDSSKDAIEIAELIKHLYDKYTTSLPQEFIKPLQRDTARRLVKIAIRNNIKSVDRLYIFQHALRFDPKILLRLTTKRLSRLLSTSRAW